MRRFLVGFPIQVLSRKTALSIKGGSWELDIVPKSYTFLQCYKEAAHWAASFAFIQSPLKHWC
jgi:hypothetical protein